MHARIVVADDFEVLRHGLKRLFNGAVCGEAENGKQAVQKVLELQPDLIILDLGMPVMNGLEATRRIRKLAPKTKILIFTMHDSPAVRDEVLQAGAHAFLHKSTPTDKVLETVKALLKSSGPNPAVAAAKRRLNIPQRPL
jgi:DNA-binding NarL/FixJ family response regulator